MYTSPLKALPSPMYGGDFYYQMGCINHVRYGGAAFDNCNLLSENPGYFPLFSIINGYAARIIATDTFKSIIIVSYLLTALSILIGYILFKSIFKDEIHAALGVLLFYIPFPLFKYTDFAFAIMAPALVLSILMFYKKQDYKNAVILGLVGGLATITHSVLLPITYLSIGFLFAFLMLDKNVNYKQFDFKKMLNQLKRLWIFIFIIFIIALPLTMLYWYQPIFKNHMETSPHYLEWNSQGDFTKWDMKISTLTGFIKSAFFDFRSMIYSIKSILTMLAVIFLLGVKKVDEERKFVIFSLSTFLIIMFSYFITVPLLGIHFLPGYVQTILGRTILPLLMMLGFGVIFALVKEIRPYKKYAAIALIVIMAFSLMGEVKRNQDNKWYGAGLAELDPAKQSLQQYMIENTDVNDVVLTTKEVGFFLNGVTGRKLITSRRAQNDAYENMDIREIEQAVILYGDDMQSKKELIKKYDVKYLYWDTYWIQSEYYFNDKGEITGWFDPLIAFNEEEYRNILNKNNVSYFERVDWVDPSYKVDWIPKFDLIFVSPDNYNNFTNPWNPNINPYLKKVWSHKQNGMDIAVLYEISEISTTAQQSPFLPQSFA